MRQKALSIAALAALLPTCTPDGKSPDSIQSAAPGSLLSHEPAADDLVFPTAGAEKIPRSALSLPAHQKVSAKEPSIPKVASPDHDGGSPVDLIGGRLRINFDQAMARPGALPKNGGKPPVLSGRIPASEGTVTIAPEVKGRAEWLDQYTLEYTAGEPLRVGEMYEISVQDVRSLSDGTPMSPWKATVIPRAVVAGKVLGHAPKPGAPRVVAMSPNDASAIGPNDQIAILYDQPIDHWLASSLVRIQKASDGTLVPISVSHPAAPTFQGVAVDPRFVVVLHPTAPLSRGEKYRLRSMPAFKDDPGRTSRFEVAEPLKVTKIDCPSYSADCSVEGNVVSTNDNEIAIWTNNPISLSDKDLLSRIHVEPKVSNLWAYAGSYGGSHLSLSGAFKHGTRYEITVSGLKDRYGSTLSSPVHAVLLRAPRDASITMASGVLILDEERMKRFAITTMSTEEAELRFWQVKDEDLWAAVKRVNTGKRPDSAPTIVRSVPITPRDNELVTTTVDLTNVLDPSARYIAAATVKRAVEGADPPEESDSRPSALIVPGGAESLAVHVQKVGEKAAVHVARLDTGEAVPGALVTLLAPPDLISSTPLLPAKTDASGLAQIPAGAEGWLTVSLGGTRTLLSLDKPVTTANRLFPHLTVGDDAEAIAPRALLFTDRGIYRPGNTIHVYSNLRKLDGERLAPVSGAAFRMRITGPSGEQVHERELTTSDLGSASASFDLPKTAKLGHHRIEVVGSEDKLLASATVQVGEVETPRFSVDVQAGATDEKALRADVLARYVFGAPMSAAKIKWTARREPARVDAGVFAEAGLSFQPSYEPWEPKPGAWARSGESTAGPDGVAKIEQAISLSGLSIPQRFVVEAEVTDASHRAIAGRTATVVHVAERYAGIRARERWTAPGQAMKVQLAVVDREGRAAPGREVSALLYRIETTEIARRDSGGEIAYETASHKTLAGRCSATSSTSPVECSLIMPAEGDYEITAVVDGRSGGSTRAWAVKDGGRRVSASGRGRALSIVTDKPLYAPGETAKLLVTSPFADATAIVTTDSPGAVARTVRIHGSSGLIDIPIEAADSPHVHAAITLLPVSARRGGETPEEPAIADYRFGAVRLPVAGKSARLALSVSPSKPEYGPGEQAEVTVTVKNGDQPVEGAEVALAVVDDGVLRLTGYHAPDPVTELRPGRAFSAEVFDTRSVLADPMSQSHVAGDGDASLGTGAPGEIGESKSKARSKLVETAFWGPHLRTDKDGQATVRFALPDNLTTFRAMAITLDKDGKGQKTESQLRVTKRLLLAPALPRFVALGDRFEAATLVHNTTGAPALVKVTLDAESSDSDSVPVRRLLVPAHGQTRVTFPLWVDCGEDEDAPDREPASFEEPFDDIAAGEPVVRACPISRDGDTPALRLRWSAIDHTGDELDAIETSIVATTSGLDEQARLEGAFVNERGIDLNIPERVVPQGNEDDVVIKVGAQMWPELGERMRFLLGYPHGCVEQTTSSTLPLLAARDIAPRIGLDQVTDADLKEKIQKGIERLGTMRTSSGGLAYWPGGSEPNPYGTAYAIRALLLAKQAGIAPPGELLNTMAEYLKEQMLAPQHPPELKSAIAQSLSEMGLLDESAADALYDRSYGQTVFGTASLALALSVFPRQKDRVETLLDRVEAEIDETGELRQEPNSSDFYYYGSATRTRAQAAMALRSLRPTSKVLPALIRGLAAQTGSYTTQATAYSLLALAEEVRQLAPDASDMTALLDGRPLSPSRELPNGGREFRIPLLDIAGKSAKLTFSSPSPKPLAFEIRARFRRAAGEKLGAFRTARGPLVYRVYTDPKGGPVDLTDIHPGQVLRVALLVRRPPEVSEERYEYLAITDRLPAGFEPVQTDLATVAAQPEIDSSHPFAPYLLYSDDLPSHVELHDDRVNVYFDHAEGDEVAASFLVRATTRGVFSIGSATAELMYEPDSLGATEQEEVVIR